VHAFIIEDDYLISRAIEDILSGLGFSRFSFARSEDTAVAGATGESFDLITADARLLPGDGVTAVETICATRSIPVIFITGYADEIRDRLTGLMSEATIVTKPINEEELAAAVRKVLGQGAAEA
jgi:DNA-binding response OmpR family regulator